MSNSIVSICSCPSYAPKDCHQAMQQLLYATNLSRIVKPGMKIAVKANLVSAMSPDSSAVTHYALIKELCLYLNALGARVIIGDSPSGMYTAAHLDNIYRASHMTDLVNDNTSLNHDFSVRPVSYPGGHILKSFTATDWLFHVDLIINFSKLKTHGMMGFSGAVKNLFGTIPGMTKPEYHYRFPNPDEFANMLIDLNEYFHPVFNIMDAVEGMEGNGPTAGTPRHIGCLLASASPYALDRCACALIGLDPMKVPYLYEASHRGLLPADSAITFDIDQPRKYFVSDYKLLPVLKKPSAFRGRLMNQLFNKVLSTRPKVTGSECIGCGKCASLCPAKAITMTDRHPSINRNQCIKCFCCQEFCPVGAMKVDKTVLLKLLTQSRPSR